MLYKTGSTKGSSEVSFNWNMMVDKLLEATIRARFSSWYISISHPRQGINGLTCVCTRISDQSQYMHTHHMTQSMRIEDLYEKPKNARVPQRYSPSSLRKVSAIMILGRRTRKDSHGLGSTYGLDCYLPVSPQLNPFALSRTTRVR